MSVVHIVILERAFFTDSHRVSKRLDIEQYCQVIKDTGYQNVSIVSPDEQIISQKETLGAQFYQLAATKLGLDYLAELQSLYGWSDSDIIVCLDDNKVCLQSGWIDLLIQVIRNRAIVDIATLAVPVRGEKFDPEVVKVITDKEERVLLFSRGLIPFDRNGNAVNDDLVICSSTLCHVNFYAARVNTLMGVINSEVSQLEHVEQCDLLRALSNGYRVQAVIVDDEA